MILGDTKQRVSKSAQHPSSLLVETEGRVRETLASLKESQSSKAHRLAFHDPASLGGTGW